MNSERQHNLQIYDFLALLIFDDISLQVYQWHRQRRGADDAGDYKIPATPVGWRKAAERYKHHECCQSSK